jgi:hypothetical protein
VVFNIVQISEMEVDHLLPELAIGPDSGTGSGETGYREVAGDGVGIVIEGKGGHEVNDGVLRTAVFKQKLSVFVWLGLN